jgi:hypothetical protein
MDWMHFRDKVDAYFPETFGNQWDQIINGRPNQREGWERYENDGGYRSRFISQEIPAKICRKHCFLELMGRLVLIPFDAIGRTIFSGSLVLIKIVEIGLRTFVLILNFSDKGMQKWCHNGCELLDYSLATVLALFQGSVKASRLFLAVICPSTLYVPPESLLTRHRMRFELCEFTNKLNKELDDLLQELKLNDSPQVIQEVSFLLTIESCLSFAKRWGLLDPPESRILIPLDLLLFRRFESRPDLRAIYHAMPVDEVKDQYHLLLGFNHVLNGERNEECLKTFFQEFKTGKQKQVLDRYFSKDFEVVWDNVGYGGLSKEVKEQFKLLRESLTVIKA